GIAPDHSIPVHGLEVQSRLSLLLVVRQQGEGNDRGRCEAFDRLVALDWLARVGVDGWRAPVAAELHSQDRLLQRAERHLRLPADEWTIDETGCDRSARPCRDRDDTPR